MLKTKIKSGNTPLHIAVQNNFKQIAQSLIEFGADINATDKVRYSIY
jgi:ankyrin repeat protein